MEVWRKALQTRKVGRQWWERERRNSDICINLIVVTSLCLSWREYILWRCGLNWSTVLRLLLKQLMLSCTWVVFYPRTVSLRMFCVTSVRLNVDVFNANFCLYLLDCAYCSCYWCGDTHYANLIFVFDSILGVMVHNRVAQWLMLLQVLGFLCHHQPAVVEVASSLLCSGMGSISPYLWAG